MGFPQPRLMIFAAFIIGLVTPGMLIAESKGNIVNAARSDLPSTIQLSISQPPKPLIQLEARNASLTQILQRITEKTGAIIHYSVLPEEPVTATCAGVTVKNVMECLLGSRIDRIYRKLPVQSAILATAKTNIQPVEIWLLGSRFGNAVSTMQCTFDGSRKTINTRGNTSDSDNSPSKSLIRMAQIDNDPRFSELRKQALSILAAQGKTGDAETDAEITETLHKALTDEDAEMRAQAVFGLMQHDNTDDTVLLEALKDK
ncbi:MAG: HEAT repeat domain-containing protein, partial [Methyloglobulus sp.]|nr:HEAT repeat domain-containing protein [Methyloglobulus sp.]